MEVTFSFQLLSESNSDSIKAILTILEMPPVPSHSLLFCVCISVSCLLAQLSVMKTMARAVVGGIVNQHLTTFVGVFVMTRKVT